MKTTSSNVFISVSSPFTTGRSAITLSRCDAGEAGDQAHGSVLASDAFFPFPDNIELAAEAGVTAVVQPGGSIRDDEVVAEANKQGLAMVFTGVRHFRH